MSSAEQSDDVECPTCGRTFGSDHGMKTHHSMSHSETLDRVEFECDWCGELDTEKTNRYEAADHHFCCEECHHSWNGENLNGEDHPRWSRIETECDWCSKDIDVVPSKYEQNKHNFCSKECSGEHRSEYYVGEKNGRYSGGRSVVEFECEWCGKESTKHENQYERNEHHFCSNECHGEWESEHYCGEGNPRWEGGKSTVEIECDWCGESATKRRSDFDESDSHFCSPTCRNTWKSEVLFNGPSHPVWKEGTTDLYGKNWQDVRNHVLERDGYECSLCGGESKDRELDVHHIIPRRQFNKWDLPIEDSNVPRNLIPLCRSCHMHVEKGNVTCPLPDSHWRSE